MGIIARQSFFNSISIALAFLIGAINTVFFYPKFMGSEVQMTIWDLSTKRATSIVNTLLENIEILPQNLTCLLITLSFLTCASINGSSLFENLLILTIKLSFFFFTDFVDGGLYRSLCQLIFLDNN